MWSSEQTMAACRVEDGPTPPHSLSPRWSPPEFNITHLDHRGHSSQTKPSNFQRSVSLNLPNNDKPNVQWHAAMLCKERIGTSEWVNCGETSCVKLRGELAHLRQCIFKHCGGCKERCKPLKDELVRIRELKQKYSTISDLAQRQPRQESIASGFKKLGLKTCTAQTRLLAEECVSTAVISPISPVIIDPFHTVLPDQVFPRETEEHDEVSVVELIPLDKSKLSVVNGCFRKYHEWQTVDFLGQGSFGKTYLCFDNHNQSYFAIKKVLVSHFNMEEIQLWDRLSGDHLNIINFYGAVKSGQHVLIFMEYMNGGSVGDYLAVNGPFNEKCALRLLHQVLCGLNFMHRKSIIHGDIKAANVLMDDIGVHVKLADFGSCVDLRAIEYAKSTGLIGTSVFMAPEICRSEFPSTSADIWSAMCFLIQIICGRPPWAEYLHVCDDLLLIIGLAKRPPQLPSCSEAMKEMFAQGFHIEARSRPSAAQLLRHPTFAFLETGMDPESSFEFNEKDHEFYEDENNTNDVSLEYFSSHSPFCTDVSEDEYFSPVDDLDVTPVATDPTSSTKAKPAPLVHKRFDSSGGRFSTCNGCCSIEVPRNSLENPTRLGLRCIDPVHFYQPLINSGLYNHVAILGHAHQFLPDRQTFSQPITVKVTLPEPLHQSEDHIVIHGHPRETNDVIWDDVTDSSRVLSFEQSTTVEASLRHFSYFVCFKTRFSLAKEFILSYLNFQPMWLRFMVFIRRDPNASDVYDICVVAIRDSFYTTTCTEKYSICHGLKEDGFHALYGKRIEYIYPKEELKVSIRCAHSKLLSRVTDGPSVITCSFGGEEVGRWRMDASETQAPLSGRVTLKRSAGQLYHFQFWEHEPMRYVQDILKLDSLAYVNMIPIADAVGVEEEKITELIENVSDDEEQLRQITDYWRTKAENNELKSLAEFISQVSKEAILVSDRGKFHLSHLNDFKVKWKEKNERDGNIEENDHFFQAMAKSGLEMCRSVFSDCVLEMDQSEEGIRTASDITNSLVKLLAYAQVTYRDYAAKNLDELLQLLKPDERDAAKARIFCESLARCIPWLVQIVKNLFKVHIRKSPTGLWGIRPSPADKEAVKAEEKLPSSEVWCQICEGLRKLCEKNVRTEDDVKFDEMENSLNVAEMLRLLSICDIIFDKEWMLLEARVRFFRLLAKESTRNKLPRILSENLHNVLKWLQRYVKFCPTKLVQFKFISLPTETEGELQYNHESRTFTQKLTLAENIRCLPLKVDINLNGCRHSETMDIELDEQEERNVECLTLSVVYEHKDDGTGFLKILNHSQCMFEKDIKGNSNQTDGQPIEEKPREISESLKFKTGIPSESDIEIIASHISKEWKRFGCKLLANHDVDQIDVNERDVFNKVSRVLEKWQQSRGTSATYCDLYHALCAINRKDLAQSVCLEPSATLL